MDSVNSNLGKTSSVSPLQALMALAQQADSNSPEAKLFAEFLQQNGEQGMQGNLIKQDLANNSSNKHLIVGPGTNNIVQPLPSLKVLSVTWHNIFNKLQNQITAKFLSEPHKFLPIAKQQRIDDSSATTPATTAPPAPSSSSSPVTASSTNAAVSAPTPQTAATDQNNTVDTSVAVNDASISTNINNVQVAQIPPSTITIVRPVQASPLGEATQTSDSSTADNLSKAPKTIVELLAELQLLAQMIAKQLQQTSGATVHGDSAANAAVGTNVNAPSDNNVAVGVNANQKTSPADNLLAALNSFASEIQDLLKASDASTADTNLSDPASQTKGSLTAISAASAANVTPQNLNNVLSLAQSISAQLDVYEGGNSSKSDSAPQVTAGTVFSPAVPDQNVQGTIDTAKVIQTLPPVMDDDDNDVSPQQDVAKTNNTPQPQVITSDKILAAATAGLKPNTIAALTPQAGGIAQEPLQKNLSGDLKNNAGTQAAVTNLSVAINETGADQNHTTDFDQNKDAQSNNNFLTSARAVTTENNGNMAALEAPTSSSSSYSFASQLASTKASGTGFINLSPAVEQVMLQLNRNVKSGNDQMTLQLNPAELGRVNIKLDISADGKVQGTVIASNPATLDSLLKDVRSLERALQDAGLRADPGSLQFSLGGQTGQSSDEFMRSASHNRNGNAGNAVPLEVAGDIPDQTEIYYLTPGRVNMRV